VNRRQRRAAKAGAKPRPRGELKDLPVGYIDDVQTMALALEVWKNDLNVIPKFAFPPKEYHMLMGIDQAPALARDDNARAFLNAASKVCKYWSGGAPTPLMLLLALELAKMPYEILPVETFKTSSNFVVKYPNTVGPRNG
jgi:hypothetical protein